jgi:predicted nucleotidyltransferase
MASMSVAFPKEFATSEALRAAKELGGMADVQAVALIGSAARGDADSGSDIDLLALVKDRNGARAVRAACRRERAGHRVQLKLLTDQALQRLLQRRSTFAVHILREGVIVDDPSGRLAAIFAARSTEEPVRGDADALRLRLEAYQDLAWCQGLYLYALSDLYSIGRAAALILLGREAHFEFSASRALRTLGDKRPELRESARIVAALRPFFLLVERDVHAPLPFPYRDCHREARRARDACEQLVATIR